MTVKAYRTFQSSAWQFPDFLCLGASRGHAIAGAARASSPATVASRNRPVQTGGILGGLLVRSVAAMIFACALGACAGGNLGTPLAGEWKVEQRADRVADKPVQSAVLMTRSRNANVSK